MPHPRSRLRRILRVRFRRLMRRVDRIAPGILLWIPSWGTSLLIHGALLLLLALYVYAHSGGPREVVIQSSLPSQLTEDLTSLIPSDHAGDPFTDLKSPEPPSLSIEPPPPGLAVVNQPV
ncbi:prenyltransferase/squalene oxidase repeat-containing protein, partial [Singulisphaera rosea]